MSGGLVGDDWLTVQWAKIDWIKAGAGLVPWVDSLAGGEAAPSPSPLLTEETPPPAPAAPAPMPSPSPPPLVPPPSDLPAALAWLGNAAAGAGAANPSPGAGLLAALSGGGGGGSGADSLITDLASRLAATGRLPVGAAAALLKSYAINLIATAGGLAGPGKGADPPPYVCLAVAGVRAGGPTNTTTQAQPTARVDLALAASAEVCAPYLIEVLSPAYAAASKAWNWRPLSEAGSRGAAGPGGRIAGVAAGAWQGLGPAQTATGVAVEVVLAGGVEVEGASPTAVAINGVPCAVVRA